MTPPLFSTVAVVGLGLIGGSLAKLIRLLNPSIRLLAVDTHQETLDYAAAHHIADDVIHYKDFSSPADLVFVCTPVHSTTGVINELSARLNGDVVFTDVASVKQVVCNGVRLSRAGHLFVGGHPMAGTEHSGVQHSSAAILREASYILIPVRDARYDALKAFLAALSFRIVEMSASVHDQLVGSASHLPYLMACLTVALAKERVPKESAELFKAVISSGFRDTTRVASSSPAWGRDMAQYNKAAFQEGLAQLQTQLVYVAQCLDSDNYEALEAFFADNREFRRFLYSK